MKATLALVSLLGFCCAPVSAAMLYPVEWSRQIGTNGFDESRSVAVDNSGNVYISGRTEGSLEGSNAGLFDAFLTKFNSAGAQLWTQQIGTFESDESHSVAVDGAGNAYIGGWTAGNLLGVNAGGRDAFLSKFSSAGAPVWTRQIGTLNSDEALSVAVDGSGNAFLSGLTAGNLSGETNAGIRDAFLVKYDTSGNEVWTRLIGTTSTDESHSVAVDNVGNAYLSGWTGGDLDGANAGVRDAFLTKINSAGNEVWSSQLGSADSEEGRSVAVSSTGSLFITGWTAGDLAGTNAGSRDAFLSKFSSTGVEEWTRQLGTVSSDESSSIAVDAVGHVYISGWTDGSLGGLSAGSADAFISKYDGAGLELWTQQLGTSALDRSYAVAVDSSGNAYLSGRTDGSLLGGFNQGSADAFVTKLTGTLIPEPATASLLVLGLTYYGIRRRV